MDDNYMKYTAHGGVVVRGKADENMIETMEIENSVKATPAKASGPFFGIARYTSVRSLIWKGQGYRGYISSLIFLEFWRKVGLEWKRVKFHRKTCSSSVIFKA